MQRKSNDNKVIKFIQNHEQNLAEDNRNKISIRNIFVYPKKSDKTYGESYFHTINDYEFKYSDAERLLDHVQMLASIANLYHQKYYCEEKTKGIFTIKNDCRYKVTRILLPEFSLYTKKPLTLPEFKEFVAAVVAMAEKQHANVHLVLSSIAVLSEDNEVINTALYVQCGPDAKVEVMSKATAAYNDTKYPKTEFFTQFPSISPGDYRDLYNQPTSSFVASQGDKALVSNRPVFEVEVGEGVHKQKYYQELVICLDAEAQKGNKYVDQNTHFLNENTDTIAADLTDVVLTANTISTNRNNGISQLEMTQVDPNHVSSARTGRMTNDILQDSEVELALKELKMKYKIQVKLSPKLFSLTGGPFSAGEFNFYPQGEKELQGFSAKLKPKIIAHNKRVLQRKISLLFNLPPINSSLSDYELIYDKLKQLFIKLNSHCTISQREKFFKTSIFNLKQKAPALIKQSYETYRELAKSPDALVSQAKVLVADLKFKLEQLNDGSNSDLLNKMLTEIDVVAGDIKQFQFVPRLSEYETVYHKLNDLFATIKQSAKHAYTISQLSTERKIVELINESEEAFRQLTSTPDDLLNQANDILTDLKKQLESINTKTVNTLVQKLIQEIDTVNVDVKQFRLVA